MKRKELFDFRVAASVVQILPNGNLVIMGRQEIRMNFEVREIAISGVVCPSDISSNNTINLEQIAEARISYSGRGDGSDTQKYPGVSLWLSTLCLSENEFHRYVSASPKTRKAILKCPRSGNFFKHTQTNKTNKKRNKSNNIDRPVVYC